MIRLSVPRRFLFIVAILAVSAPFTVVHANETTTSGGIQIINVGMLSASIGDGDIGFRTADESAASTTAISGDVMFAHVPIIISDDRADGERDPYSIVLTVSNQISGSHFILAGNITVVGVEGLPDAGLVAGFNGAESFSEPVTIVRSTAAPPAGTFNIIMHLQMNVPAGTVPGNYSGSVSLDVLPGG